MMDKLYDLCGIPFGWIMRLIYEWVDNYAVAILLFTIFTRLILFPISYKQQKNSARMQRINPKMEKLRKKYSKPEDRQKLQEEQMKLYQEENVNPGASCLPMFIQFFILFGILDVVYKPLSYILKVPDTIIGKAFEIVQKIDPDLAEQGTSLRQELIILKSHHGDPSAFGDTLSGYSQKMADFYDNFNLFGLNLGEIPSWKPDVWDASAIGLFLIPILSGVLQLIMTIYMQVVQKKKNPNMPNMGCMNGMLYIMPIFSVWFAFQVPAGVGFYWVCSSFFSLVQSVGLNMYFTPERIEKICKKEDEKNAKKYANGKKSFYQRMMESGQTAQMQDSRRKRQEETEGMSKAELNKYNQQVLKEARKRLAEKYGEVYDETEDDKPEQEKGGGKKK